MVLPCPRVPPPGSALRPPLLEAQAGARAVPLSPLGHEAREHEEQRGWGCPRSVVNSGPRDSKSTL